MGKRLQIAAFAVIFIMLVILQVQLWLIMQEGNNSEYNQQLQAQTITQLQDEITTITHQLNAIKLNECVGHSTSLAIIQEELNQALATQQPFSHGLTAAQVKEALLKAEEALLTAEIFGRAPAFVGIEAMTVSQRYVLAQITEAFIGNTFDLLLSYEVEGLGPFLTIAWTIVGTNDLNISPRYFQPRTPNDLTAEESVTVRFFYYCSITDPQAYNLPEAFKYEAEEIPGQCLWAEFRRLMLKHTGINVWDLWFEGDKLYVDLHYTEWMPFNWGSTGSVIRGGILTRTIASLPGVASFEILVGGIHGYETSHYNFNWVAIVENGEVIRFDPGQ